MRRRPGPHVNCHYCNTVATISATDIEEIGRGARQVTIRCTCCENLGDYETCFVRDLRGDDVDVARPAVDRPAIGVQTSLLQRLAIWKSAALLTRTRRARVLQG